MRRRLLLTGMTPVQCGSDRAPPLMYEKAFQAWKVALEEAGYEVDWRGVTPGEDLSSYHKVLVGLSKPDAIACNRIFGGLWALAARPDAVLLLDDWQTGVVIKGFQTVARDIPVRLYRLARQHRDLVRHELPEEQKRAMEAVLMRFAQAPWPSPVLVPVIGDGADLQNFKVPQTIWTADPSHFWPVYSLPPAPKERRWVYCSLLDKPKVVEYYQERVVAPWRLLLVGTMMRTDGHVGDRVYTGDLERIPAPDMLHIYNKSWGMVLPEHPCAGTGWWRPRLAIAAELGCVLSMCPADAAYFDGPMVAMGGPSPYASASDPQELTDWSDDALQALNAEQKRALYARRWPKERTLQVLTDIVEGRHGQAT